MKRIFHILLVSYLLVSCTETISDSQQEDKLPLIYPDYIGVTIPVNIAPLNFSLTDEAVARIDAVVTDCHGHSLHSQGQEAVDFDIDDWHTLLGQNRGDSLTVTVSAKYNDGWHTYRSFAIYVSLDSIDYGICFIKQIVIDYRRAFDIYFCHYPSCITVPPVVLSPFLKYDL